jgi:hypothetical protein
MHGDDGQSDLFDREPEAARYSYSGIPPEVYSLFEQLTFEVINRGLAHYSSDAILHRIRWHFHIERDDQDFKCNNNWTADLSRWFMKTHPEHDGFFEIRIRKSLASDGEASP